MSRCPTCGTLYPPEARFCPRDGARLLDTAGAGTAPAATGVAAAGVTSAVARRDATPAGAPELKRGELVHDRYEVEHKLGEGGMSSVYLVRDIATGDRYAMKVLHRSLSSDEKAMARLRREAGFGMRLAHPNVCHILHLGETAGGLVYVVMPYIEGEILSDRVFRRGALPLAEVVRHVQDIAAGLHVAHRLGIVHRDLKPENVMICPRPGGTDTAVVMDFGLAKERRADAEVQKLTATGIILGTPEFMSPEQIRGKPLDPRSDVYALALMTFEMLTGRLPFPGSTAQEVMIARLRGEPLSLRAVRPDLEVPEGVDRAVRQGLASDPVDRFRTAPDFATALAAGAAGTPGGTEESWLARLRGRRMTEGGG
ncbi:MAG TPA: serine/threonine-protein kinase [Gemmatimonadaceae bacterium]|nr:serine/threonine-protein kinase [Gemmatimonadaceae bacterium]